VYELTLDAKSYFGVSNNPAKRFDGHCAHPPYRMRTHLKGRDFRVVVHMKVLEEFATLHDAEKREADLIRVHKTTKIEHGYNTLDSKPGWSRKWWWLFRRGLLPNQVNTVTNSEVYMSLCTFDNNIDVGDVVVESDVEILKEVEVIDISSTE
jgi:predicted GIY-YIG superfamily endonuclease